MMHLDCLKENDVKLSEKSQEKNKQELKFALNNCAALQLYIEQLKFDLGNCTALYLYISFMFV